MEAKTNSLNLVVAPVSEPGALFIYGGSDLLSLLNGPTVVFQTNTPLADDSGLSLPLATGATNSAFFFAAHCPGRSVDQFGDREYFSQQPAPSMILVSSGLPPSLASGQAFTVDLFVTDPLGRLLNISGAVQIMVARRSDAAIHPDARVIPAELQLTGGRLRASLTVESITSLDGYCLGLGPAPAGGAGIGFLAPALNLGPEPLPSTTPGDLLQTLDGLRQAAIDPGAAWDCPLSPGAGYEVSGTFGEWRGKDNLDVHAGLDLAAAATVTVVASRGGVVSCRGTLSGMGDYLVLDHGDGWFSRYLHLDGGCVAVSPGQTVARGTPLATGLYSASNWPVHLHFELRRNGQAQWGAPMPGSSQDPLQTAGIFSPPPGFSPPVVNEIGFTHNHPGQYPYSQQLPDAGSPSGPLYLCARLADPEPGAGGGEYYLGLRRISFQAEGMSQSVDIQPIDDAAISQLAVPGAGQQAGFAKYTPLQAANPDPLARYLYWWAWNTAPYAGNPQGPRTFTLTSQAYGGTSTTNSFSFGPEIKGNVWEPLGNQTYRVTIVAHLGASQLTQPDQYKLEVLRGDRTPMPGAQWDAAGPPNVTCVFTNHLDTSNYTFHIPQSENATNMIVRLSSLMAPDLRHEVSQGIVYLSSRYSNAPALVDIPAGAFLMGSPLSEAERSPWEGPQTFVTISHSFKMGKFEVTQAQYQSLMSNNPSYFSGHPAYPIEQVTWTNAMEYCRRLTAIEQQTGCLPAGWSYRLPTEAEWEYACRAGTASAFYFGEAIRSGMANFDGSYEYDSTVGEIINPLGEHLWQTIDVGSYVPNSLGLYDMHGNVWEWCLDYWAFNLPGGNMTDPQGPPSGSNHVVRGGCWYDSGKGCRSACRLPSNSAYSGNDIGFRVVLAPDSY